MFCLTFYWTYNLLLHRYKFIINPRRWINWTLIGLLVAFMAWQYFVDELNGLNFFYQNFLGQVYSMIGLVFCSVFDKEIHRLCEKTGFILQTSREKKFQVFFACLAMFVTQLVFYYAF